MKRAIGPIAFAFLIACAHAPTKPGERADLTMEAQQTAQRMMAKDPALRSLMESSAGYIVFPKIGEGGFIIGGGAGSGVVFEGGQQTGFAQVSHMGIGGIAGGQSYAELIIVKDRFTLDQLKAGKFDFGAKATAVVARSGAAASTRFENGVAVFIDPIKGAMVNASLTGQKIKFSM